MINIRCENLEKGSCNFCSRGELRADSTGLKFPYRKVFVLNGSGLEVRMCLECFNELKKRAKEQVD